MFTKRTIQLKSLSVILTLMMIAAAFAGMSATAFAASAGVWDGASVDTTWYNTEDTSFTIDAPEELAGLAAIVNGTAEGITQDDFEGKTVTLGADITLSESSDLYCTKEGVFGATPYRMGADYYELKTGANIWTPIGTAEATSNTSLSNQNLFRGTFDGAGYMVSGLYTDGTKTVQGLFGCLGAGAAVKNLTVDGCVMAKIVGGGIAAYVNGASITNCTNKAVVYADGGEAAGSGLENGVSRGGAVGGIAGVATGTIANKVLLSGCTNEGAVTCTNTNKGGRTGGILGLVDNAADAGNIENCINKGTIKSYQYSGGIVGMNEGTAFAIRTSVNTGEVGTFSPSHAYGGGIAGSCASSIISSCYNRGNFVGTVDPKTTDWTQAPADPEHTDKDFQGDKVSMLGGIVGNFSGTAIMNCYNTGEFVSVNTKTIGSVGGICASGYGTSTDVNKLKNCYCITDTAYDNVDYVTVLSSDDLKGKASALGLYYVPAGEGQNDGYPILTWQQK